MLPRPCCRPVFLPAKKEGPLSSDQPLVKGDDVAAKAANQSFKFMLDLAAGGTAGGISKTVVAPIERVKLLLQTQHSNPRIKSGEIAPYTGESPQAPARLLCQAPPARQQHYLHCLQPSSRAIACCQLLT